MLRKFEVEIDLPTHHHDEFKTGDISYIHEKFYAINWQRLFLMQTQAKTVDASFVVLDLDTQQYLHIHRNMQTKRNSPVFEIQSNIPIILEKKKFFGLFKRKKKSDLIFRNLNQMQVSEQLSLFLHGQVNEMSEQYKQYLDFKMSQTHRLAS